MSALADTAAEYLQLRRLLGHNLDEAHRLLPRFVAYLDSIGASTVTIDAALAWATDGVDPATTNGARRMGIARGFARHMAGIDVDTQIPPAGLIPMRQRWRPPVPLHPRRYRHAAGRSPGDPLAAPGSNTRDVARPARRHRDARR